jgi:hypothetical protein
MFVIDAIQDLPAHRQIAALACSFILLCQHLQVETVDVFGYVSKMIRFAWSKYPEFPAIKMYMENELK